ncbi:hypothetical protein EYF80_043852 [Liparis tanakae]|uniref:Uncharacterized protein n=1 Tax=Liparis tanakae TaxID=230148 RepID=A0A4Z2FYA0_9TELE|nr:hypothetical protein EYF80_043852 [Liparis tanakae]
MAPCLPCMKPLTPPPQNVRRCVQVHQVLVAMHAGATATATAHALRDCNWSVSHAGGVATGISAAATAAAPDAGFGTGTGEDAGICCERRLGCGAFRGLNLRRGDERGGRTPQRRVEPPIRRLGFRSTSRHSVLMMTMTMMMMKMKMMKMMKMKKMTPLSCAVSSFY